MAQQHFQSLPCTAVTRFSTSTAAPTTAAPIRFPSSAAAATSSPRFSTTTAVNTVAPIRFPSSAAAAASSPRFSATTTTIAIAAPMRFPGSAAAATSSPRFSTTTPATDSTCVPGAAVASSTPTSTPMSYTNGFAGLASSTPSAMPTTCSTSCHDTATSSSLPMLVMPATPTTCSAPRPGNATVGMDVKTANNSNMLSPLPQVLTTAISTPATPPATSSPSPLTDMALDTTVAIDTPVSTAIIEASIDENDQCNHGQESSLLTAPTSSCSKHSAPQDAMSVIQVGDGSNADQERKVTPTVVFELQPPWPPSLYWCSCSRTTRLRVYELTSYNKVHFLLLDLSGCGKIKHKLVNSFVVCPPWPPPPWICAVLWLSNNQFSVPHSVVDGNLTLPLDPGVQGIFRKDLMLVLPSATNVPVSVKWLFLGCEEFKGGGYFIRTYLPQELWIHLVIGQSGVKFKSQVQFMQFVDHLGIYTYAASRSQAMLFFHLRVDRSFEWLLVADRQVNKQSELNFVCTKYMAAIEISTSEQLHEVYADPMLPWDLGEWKIIRSGCGMTRMLQHYLAGDSQLSLHADVAQLSPHLIQHQQESCLIAAPKSKTLQSSVYARCLARTETCELLKLFEVFSLDTHSLHSANLQVSHIHSLVAKGHTESCRSTIGILAKEMFTYYAAGSLFLTLATAVGRMSTRECLINHQQRCCLIAVLSSLPTQLLLYPAFHESAMDQLQLSYSLDKSGKLFQDYLPREGHVMEIMQHGFQVVLHCPVIIRYYQNHVTGMVLVLAFSKTPQCPQQKILLQSFSAVGLQELTDETAFFWQWDPGIHTHVFHCWYYHVKGILQQFHRSFMGWITELWIISFKPP